MNKSINILDEDYLNWIQELCKRYRQSQIKAAVKVNKEMLQFYWDLGRDIVELQAEKRWGEKVISRLSKDLRKSMPEAKCFSETNLLYMKNFYRLYYPIISFTPQAGEQISFPFTPQVGEQLRRDIFCVPWGHHKLLIDKCRNDLDKTVFLFARL